MRLTFATIDASADTGFFEMSNINQVGNKIGLDYGSVEAETSADVVYCLKTQTIDIKYNSNKRVRTSFHYVLLYGLATTTSARAVARFA